MKSKFLIAVVVTATILAACQKAIEKSASISDVQNIDMPDTPALQSEASAENSTKTIAPIRKFIRTAQLQLKVPSVNNASHKLTQLAKSYGGFVTNSEFTRNILEQKTIQFSKDSAMETTKYELRNSITIRVPDKLLDTTIQQIELMAKYLDNIHLSADDVSLQMLANDITIKNIQKQNTRLNRKLNQTSLKYSGDNEEYLANNQAGQTRSYIENLSLNDQVNYSTVNIQLYQNAAFEQEAVINPNIMSHYKTPFGIRMANSLQFGWELFKDFFVMLITAWPFILLGVILMILFKKRPLFANRKIATLN